MTHGVVNGFYWLMVWLNYFVALPSTNLLRIFFDNCGCRKIHTPDSDFQFMKSSNLK